MIQNRFHFAIMGQTAAEIIYTTVDSTKEHMGLTTWKHAPHGRILKSDTVIAKNYLPEKKIRRLERTVTAYFDYVEDLIEDEIALTMEDFSLSVNEFLAFRKLPILQGKGKVSSVQAKNKAHNEYDEYNKQQAIESDFDKFSKRILEKGGKHD